MSDLSSKLANANSTENDSNDNDASEEVPDFVANETADGYLLFGNAKALAAAVNEAVGIERPELNTYRLSREDIAQLRKQAEQEGWAPNAAYWAVLSAMKSWLGDRQRDGNEFGIGLVKDDDGAITGWADGQYAAYFGETMPSVESEALDPGEVAALEERGIEVGELGNNPDEVPQLPVLRGTRIPVFVETFEELDAAIEQIGEFPEEPSLGNTSEAGDEEGAEFPVLEGTLDDLDEALDGSQDVDTLEAMLEAEREGKDRKGGVSRIEDAIEAASEASESDGGSDTGTSSSGTSPEDKIQAFNNLVEGGMDAEEAAEKVGL